jgi:hypothetical protein
MPVHLSCLGARGNPAATVEVVADNIRQTLFCRQGGTIDQHVEPLVTGLEGVEVLPDFIDITHRAINCATGCGVGTWPRDFVSRFQPAASA